MEFGSSPTSIFSLAILLYSSMTASVLCEPSMLCNKCPYKLLQHSHTALSPRPLRCDPILNWHPRSCRSTLPVLAMASCTLRIAIFTAFTACPRGGCHKYVVEPSDVNRGRCTALSKLHRSSMQREGPHERMEESNMSARTRVWLLS